MTVLRIGRALGTTLLLGAGLLVHGSVAGAAAAGESCHGEPATIVGTPGVDLTGTAGADVIVSNGARSVTAAAGDDLVCVTGGSGLSGATVLGGDGHDTVDTSASQAPDAFVDPGPGDDTVTGGPRRDVVYATLAWEEGPDGEGSDTISTGGGADLVMTGDRLGSPDRDVIDLGPGADDAWLQGAVDPAHPVVGGPGDDVLEVDRHLLRHALVLDNSLGQATDGGVPVTAWGGFERFRLSPIGPWVPPAFVGGDGPERLWTSVPLTSVTLGGGDDALTLELQGRLVDGASYDGGGGDDSFALYAGAGDQARRVLLDLPGEHLRFRRDREAVEATLRGFEQHRLSAWRLDVTGSASADQLEVLGCRGLVAGGRGADLVRLISPDDVGCGYLGDDAELVVRGGGGDDTLRGDLFPDTLLGGPGEDAADGRGGRDRCRAESVVHCER